MSVGQRILRRTILLETGCRIWQGGADSKDYGMIYHEGKPHYIHRLVYEEFNGELLTGEVVRHTCDTPRCCEPTHLLKGSRGDNIRDAFERGQLKRKLSPSIVQQLQEGLISPREVSAQFGVTMKYAYNVKLGHKRRAACK